MIQISLGYAVIHGLPEGTTQIARSAWLALMQPEDTERIQVLRSSAFREHQSGYKVEYRIVHSSGVIFVQMVGRYGWRRPQGASSMAQESFCALRD